MAGRGRGCSITPGGKGCVDQGLDGEGRDVGSKVRRT